MAAFWGLITEIPNIAAQGCISAAHLLPEITEKWLCVGAYAPTHNHFSGFYWNFAL
jgi:hypothetical protein